MAVFSGDITLPAMAERIVNAARDHFGRVNVLVNNAGIFRSKPLTDYPIGELDSYLGYLRGTFVLTQAVVRQMQRQGNGGAIVNIVTILAFNGVAVAPGTVPTPLYGDLSKEQFDSLHNMQPLGRYGTPSDIADAVVYLANATWVTGVILPVDGGVDAGGDGDG